MKNTSLNDIAVFAEVARAGGFRAAADKINLSVGSVSETIQRLESRLEVRLIERTTRKISLTYAGEKLLQRSLPALADLESALNDVGEDPQAISGTLRLSAPRSSSPFFLDELITDFCHHYPAAQIQVIYDDNKVDLVTSGVDAAIRSQSLLERETYAVEIGPRLEMALVGAPSYLEKYGHPEHPSDLAEHQGILFSFGEGGRLAPWTFVGDNKSSYAVTPSPRMIVNDLMSMVHFAKSGLGLTYTYRKPAESLLQTGELISLFEDSIPDLPSYTINYLTKRHMPARLRAFIDLAKAKNWAL